MTIAEIVTLPKVNRKRAAYKRAFDRIADMRARGKTTVRINLADLEALLAIAAQTDLGVAA